jgi:hypothetical protein
MQHRNSFEWKNGCDRYGGAYQYVKWANKTSILDFYDEPCVGWYKNNVERIVTRVNSITGVAYRDDPAIFGWELINEPHVPGDDSGSILTVCLHQPQNPNPETFQHTLHPRQRQMLHPHNLYSLIPKA